MYTVRVEDGFSALHQLRLRNGSLEPQHGHDWRVRAYFSRDALDEIGMVVDFEDARSALRSVLGPLEHGDLNRLDGLSGLNPTAEVVAEYVYGRLAGMGFSTIQRIEVFEAPGCMAVYAPDSPRGEIQGRAVN